MTPLALGVFSVLFAAIGCGIVILLLWTERRWERKQQETTDEDLDRVIAGLAGPTTEGAERELGERSSD
jgi:hypothetical protein